MYGTITSHPSYNYEAEVQRARDLIQQLIAKDKLDELRISIVSGEEIKIVEKGGKILEQTLKGIDKIHFGHHHANCKMMHIGGPIREDGSCKCDQIINNLKICNHTICYYADGNQTNLLMAKLMLPRVFPNMKFVFFVPKDEALIGLNNAVEIYLSC